MHDDICNHISFLGVPVRQSKGSLLVGIREVRHDIELSRSIVDGDVADRKVIDDFLLCHDPCRDRWVQFEFAVG